MRTFVDAAGKIHVDLEPRESFLNYHKMELFDLLVTTKTVPLAGGGIRLSFEVAPPVAVDMQSRSEAAAIICGCDWPGNHRDMTD